MSEGDAVGIVIVGGRWTREALSVHDEFVVEMFDAARVFGKKDLLPMRM